MLTRNYYLALAAREFGKLNTVIDVTGKENAQCGVPYNGSSGTIKETMNSPQKGASMLFAGVYFGTGTTPPTMDDYKLAGDVFTTHSTVASVTTVHEDTLSTVTALYNVCNTGTADVTIGEIGLVSTIYQGSSGLGYMMIERTVLDEPVTIPAGGVGQVTYTIRMNYPTA